MTTIYKTLENKVIAEGEQLPDTFLMIEDGKATLVEFKNGEVTFLPFSADLLAIVEGSALPTVRVENVYDAATRSYAVSLIRADQYGEWIPACYCYSRKSEAQAKERELRRDYCEVA